MHVAYYSKGSNEKTEQPKQQQVNIPDKYYLSTISNVVFPIGVSIATGSLFMSAVASFLMLASASFHWMENEKHAMPYEKWRNSLGWKTQKADEIAMFFMFLSCIWYVSGGGIVSLLFFLSLATAMAFTHQKYGNTMIGILVLICMGVALATSIYPLIGIPFFIGALLAGRAANRAHENGEHRKTDALHGLWHILAGIGIAFMIGFV